MFKQLIVLLLLLCLTGGAATAVQPADKQTQREHKALEKAQRKQLRQEIRHFETLRNDAVMQFAREHQPSAIFTPSLRNDLRVSDVICVGDRLTGTVMVYMNVTPLLDELRLYMGGERNGTCAIAKGDIYPGSDHYGRVYTLRPGDPEQVVVTFYNVSQRIEHFDRVDISMGLALMTLNIITLRDVSIFWTYSDKVIGNYVKEQAAKTAN